VDSLAKGISNLSDTNTISHKINWNLSFLTCNLQDFKVIFLFYYFILFCLYSLTIIKLFISSTYYFSVAGTSLLFVTKWKSALDWFRWDRWHAPDCVQNNQVVTFGCDFAWCKWSVYFPWWIRLNNNDILHSN